MTSKRSKLLTALAARCAVALAACGSSSKSNTTAHTSNQALRFANCMRSHGVPNFPDPGQGGGIKLTPSSGIDPRSPAFQAAQRACKAYAPGGPSPVAMSESQRLRAVAFAKCMRSHGQSNFPDPILGAPTGNTPVLALQGMFFSIGSGIDPRSTAFRQSATRCGLNLP